MDRGSPDNDRASAAVEGWRGHVTLVFADLCDYTALSESSDPEETDLLRRQVEEAALAAIQRHGGAVNQFYGDGILAMFGFPTAREDDAKRAIEAAIDLREATGKLRPRLGASLFEVRMHIGIHSGLVFVRAGDALHGKYDLTGDAVNTTARLCNAAGPGEILVSEITLRGNEAFFAHQSQVELSLKGRRAPIVAHKVTSRSSVQSRFEARTRRGLTELVARETELAELERVIDSTLLGQPRLAVVSGAAGIGKSRLLAEFRSRAAERGVPTLFGCCAGSGEMVALEPFIHALRQLFGIQPASRVDDAVRAVEAALHTLGELGERLLPALLQLLSLPASNSRPEHADAMPPVENVLCELVAALAARSPLVLVLDDWQWADDASRKVLNNLRRLADTALGVIVAIRELEATDPALHGARLLPLTPLSEEQTAQMIRALRPHDLELRIAQAIHRRSGGNPLFVEELCHSLYARQGQQWLEHSGLPPTLQGVIQSRIALLPPADAEILRVLSVFGPEVSLSLLSEVVEVDDLRGSLAALVREDILHSTEHDDVFRFKHGLARDVIYETVLIAERRRIHYAIARTIERQVASGALADQSEALAYHYSGAGDYEGAAKYAELAGNKAMAASALDRARFQYEAALSALDRLPLDNEHMRRWLAISTQWAGACIYNPAPYQLPLLQRASRYASELADEGAQAQIEYWLGWIHYGLGEYVEAKAHCRNALVRAAAIKDEWFVAQLYANLGQSHATSGEYADAVAALTHSIGMRRGKPRYARGQPVSQGFAYSLGTRASAWAAMGDFDTADADMAEALAIAKHTGHPVEGSLLALEALVEIYRGRWEVAAQAASASCAVGERVYSAYIFSISSAFKAYAHFMLTHSPESLLDLRKAIQWLERHDFRLMISVPYGLMAEASIAAGDLDAASDYAERALARASRSDPLGEIMAYRALARRHSLDGPTPAEVERCLASAFAAAEQRGSRRDTALTRLLQGELGLRAGDSKQTESALSSALSEFEAMNMHWYADKARRLLELSPLDLIGEPPMGSLLL